MLCPKCHVQPVKAGFYGKNRVQMYRCKECGKRFGEPQAKPLGDRRLPMETILLILRCLIEGTGVRGTARLCDVQKRTVLNVLKAAGENCEKLLGQKIRNVPVKDVQADEVWGFIRKKEKAVEEGDDPSFGDVYCFVGIERNTKLVLNFALGKRNQATTDAFIEGLRAATSDQEFQITTDGFQPYVSAIDTTLSDRVNYAQLIKTYRATPEGEHRYSPAEVVSVQTILGIGNPDPTRICTSHVERQNLTMRMQIKRLARLTLCFSKKFENLWAALCLYFGLVQFWPGTRDPTGDASNGIRYHRSRLGTFGDRINAMTPLPDACVSLVAMLSLLYGQPHDSPP